MDILIKNEAGTAPVATAQSDDANINVNDLHVTNLDPTGLIILNSDYLVGLDDGTGMVGRTCIEKNGNTATFRK
ncbi:hypothetical protein HJP15_18850 [Pseudoalteromonas sp. NEC-BIFX-2020_002]|uniref:Uncharacterized protein n=1 Tax=Pseudoalteromonas neustonica TaxID=1840331 RepID=A0ABU9U832_9GAMM|nr:hypothetical protein [Pseudoalteromonas sp. NEC-BIFX-2020_002]NNG44950.1 hypothetical protein [Pseudoalteromonas sp. NEC-BIFX-2020_002]